MLGILYITSIFLGWLLLIPYTKKTEDFRWKEYVAMITIPVIGLIGLIYLKGTNALWVYIIGMILGPILEHLIGWFYHKVNGAHLWVYHRLPISGGYTSFLVAPLWGFAFVFIWMIVELF